MTDYDAAVAWLYNLEAAKGMDFKLERVELALEALGNPQQRYRVVHVAGTNGKGSVAAMVHAILHAAGRGVGLYTSPHLVRFTERIRIGAEEISRGEVVELVEEIRSAVTSRGIDLTFFELTTVMAFAAFARRAVEFAIVEVGLGGRLDATNVVDPAVSVITTIGLDHQEYLGNTIESIAGEKGGIIKSGRPLVCGRMPAAAMAVLRGLAEQRHSPVRELGIDFDLSGPGPLTYRGPRLCVDRLQLALAGDHQRDNAAVAVAGVEAITDGAIEESAIRDGLGAVDWPGRLQIVGASPRIVLDGAHNADGVRALCRALDPLARGRRVHLLFAVMGDKDWHPMVESLSTIASDVTVCEILPPRGASAEEVAIVFGRYLPVAKVTDPTAALARVLERCGRDDLVLVTGSLFLIGAVLPLLQDDLNDVAPSHLSTP